MHRLVWRVQFQTNNLRQLLVLASQTLLLYGCLLCFTGLPPRALLVDVSPIHHLPCFNTCLRRFVSLPSQAFLQQFSWTQAAVPTDLAHRNALLEANLAAERRGARVSYPPGFACFDGQSADLCLVSMGHCIESGQASKKGEPSPAPCSKAWACAQ